MNKPALPFLETMITQACNLSCQGCTNYSDLKHSGYVSWSIGQQWIQSWLDRISIPDFGIMGGEPLINPEFLEWLYGCRELLPKSQLRFTTNGLLLHKYPDLLDQMIDLGNIVFKISVHVDDDLLEQQIENIFKSYDWQPILEFGIQRWITNNNTRFQINRPSKFIKTFQGSYVNMIPHKSNPLDSFELCVQKTCPLLYQGKIFKCSTAGLLEPILNRFNNNNPHWTSYIDHGIDHDCTDAQLTEFLNNFGKPNRICGQCPTINNTSSIINHRDTVTAK